MAVEHGGASSPRVLISAIVVGVLVALVVFLLRTGLAALWHWILSVPSQPLLPALAVIGISLALATPFCLYCLFYRGARLERPRVVASLRPNGPAAFNRNARPLSSEYALTIYDLKRSLR